jgi:signal transduction histidine kinase
LARIGADITVQRQTERLRNELVGIVSHELRGPLTAIRAGLRLIEPQLTQLDDRSRRMADIAARNCDRLVRVVNDLLDLERIESGQMPMDRAAIAARRVLDEAVDVTAPLAEEAGVEIAASCETDADVVADLDRTVQALTNLMRNAISFSARGSRIEVSARARDDEFVVFAVRDHARGIPAEALGRIFERFQQVAASDSRERTGTGLGLAISRAIVEQQGGEISVESTVGVGSTFRVTVPRA